MDQAIERGVQCAATPDIAGFLRSGREFHGLVGRSSGNWPLTEFVTRNEERVDLYLLSYGKAVDAVGMQASNREHSAIFKSIAERDPEAAARLVVYHAQSTRERWSALFGDAEGEEAANLAVPAGTNGHRPNE
jgi:DNA-binding GntR family transcriptional regulator